jgi:hypothetical protein
MECWQIQPFIFTKAKIRDTEKLIQDDKIIGKEEPEARYYHRIIE